MSNQSQIQNDTDLTAKTLQGMWWMLSGTWARFAVQTALFLVLARLLTPHDFGLIASALVLNKFAEQATYYGLSQSLIQRDELSESDLRSSYSLSLIISGLMISVVWLSTPLIAWLFHSPELRNILPVLIWIFPFQAITSVCEAILYRRLDFKKLAFLDVIVYVFAYALVASLLAFLGHGVWSLVWAQVSSVVLKCVLVFRASPFPLMPLLDGAKMLVHVRQAFGFTVDGLISFVSVQGDNLTIGLLLGPVSLGLYGRAYQLMSMPISLFGQVMKKVLFSTFSRVKDEEERLSIAVRRGLAGVALVTIPIASILVVTAPEMIRVILGPAWIDATLPFQILAPGMFLRLAYRLADNLAWSKGAVYKSARRRGVYAGCVIVGAVVGSGFGIPGVAFGIIVALVIYYLLAMHLVTELSNLRVYDLWCAHLPGIICGSLALSVSLISICICRFHSIPDALTLAVTLVTTGACLLFASVSVPGFALGRDGLWWKEKLATTARNRLPSSLARRTA
ncbi:MAG: lipopolysaccharide biosynthesis protein [Planctomycetota bacterium]